MFISRFIARFFLFCLLLPLIFISSLSAQHLKGLGTSTKPYTIVYKLKTQSEHNRTSEESLQQALQKIGATGNKRKFPENSVSQDARKSTSYDISRIYELKYSPDISFDKVKNLLLATGQVDYVEPLYVRVPLHQPNDPFSDSTKNNQYYLKLIQAYEGWATEKGDTNVVIGILDTGFRLSHEDLATKVKRNYKDPIDGIDNDGDGYIDNYYGWDFGDWDNDVVDNALYGGHGTSVAGAAVAATNNEKGIAGVGYKIKFMPIKVFSSLDVTAFGGYEAIVYAANKGCKVINLSWGGEGHSKYEQDIINYAVFEKDVVIVAAGGNTPGYNDIYPASYANVLSVGGTDSNDIKYFQYSHNVNIDLTAPSRGVYTTSSMSDTSYGNLSGTSIGSPIVAGCAALVRSKYPNLNAWQIIERLRITSDNIYDLAGNQPYFEMLGSGRINLKRALRQQQVKAVRCVAFAIDSKYAPPAGTQASIRATFTNYLDPITNLTVTLTSASPYVTILQNNLNVGSLGTMSSKVNTASPFTFKVAENTPANTLIPFRLAYSDGTYKDFQYFMILVNPDFIALDANNLEATVNSKGNIGYNGFNFEQGEGIKYKNGIPLLFEGGLMIATSETQVSDNVRSDMWISDGDFIPKSIAKRTLNTPLATQEIRSVMHDNHNTPGKANVGVQVKQISYAWSDNANRDFVVLEYHIKNTTNDLFQNLYAGLFADWDIGEYNLNKANWDEANKLGYVHHATRPFPYAGIKLLTNDSPAYYAIDNLGAADDTMSIEDGFTSAEKFKTLSGGVKRTTAGKEKGNNVSHVVSTSFTGLAPGETKIIAFALIVSDNLEELKQGAIAAQQKYISFRTSQAPLVFADTACAGTKVTWVPKNGTKFRFYSDQQKKNLLSTGASYTIENFSQKTTIFAAGIDSVFESAAVPATFSLPISAVADFSVEPSEIFVGMPVTFVNKSTNSINWQWHYGETTPFTGKDFTHTFNQAGLYQIKLTVTDRFGCSETSVLKTVEVKAANPNAILAPEPHSFTLYPNPTSGLLYIKLKGNRSSPHSEHPKVTITDVAGKIIHAPIFRKDGELVIDLSTSSAGVYLAHITHDKLSIVKRIVVIKP